MSEQRSNENIGEMQQHNIKDGILEKDTGKEWKKTVLKDSNKLLSTRENGYWMATDRQTLSK